MIDSSLIELMNLELDGTATEPERARLRRHLENDPEARAHFGALGGLIRRLDTTPLIDPPAELRPRIVSALDRAVRPAPAPRPGTRLRALFSRSGLRLGWTYGLGVATGVFLLAAVYSGRDGGLPGAVDPAHVSGSMVPALSSKLIGNISITPDVAGFSGGLEVFGGPAETVAEVSFDSPEPVAWIMEFDRDALAVTRVDTPRNGLFEVSPGAIHAVHPGGGPQRVVFSGRAEPVQSIVLKVVKSGQVVFERSALPVKD